jgi:hypothetical protein
VTEKTEISVTILYEDMTDISDQTIAAILRAAVGGKAGHCVRVHWSDPKEQSLFDRLGGLIGSSARRVR